LSALWEGGPAPSWSLWTEYTAGRRTGLGVGSVDHLAVLLLGVPRHLALRDSGDELVEAAPCYLKLDSYGELVFDWSDLIL